jgi:effector-binding domain-containing protein
MFRIGEFSKIGRVTVKTLRWYDKMGLLRPSYVEETSGYRFYTLDQLPRLYRILALKDLGFSLDSISDMLKDSISTEQMRGMLRLRQAELQQRVAEDRERLTRVEARLRQIEQEGSMSAYEAVLKRVESQKVASIRDTVLTYRHVGGLFEELFTYLGSKQTQPDGPTFTIYYDGEYRERDVDAEAVAPIAGNLDGNERVRVYELPGLELAASVIHHGAFNNLSEAYNAVMTWIQDNGYRIIGPEREIYLVCGPAQDDPSYVTEIQFPVAKR